MQAGNRMCYCMVAYGGGVGATPCVAPMAVFCFRTEVTEAGPTLSTTMSFWLRTLRAEEAVHALCVVGGLGVSGLPSHIRRLLLTVPVDRSF